MKGNKTLIFFGILIILLAGAFIVYLTIFQSSESSVEKTAVDIKISAEELVNSFESDEQEANARYLDKVLQVNGNIESISEDDMYISITLKKPEAISGVICSFDKSTLENTGFQTGNNITVKGICAGYLIDVVLTKCALVE